jgi:hypothetical protein
MGFTKDDIRKSLDMLFPKRTPEEAETAHDRLMFRIQLHQEHEAQIKIGQEQYDAYVAQRQAEKGKLDPPKEEPQKREPPKRA